MLRHYDRLGLVRPTGRTSGGYREYAETDLRRILHVEMLRSLGLSLEQTREALDDPATAPAQLVAELAAQTRARIAVEEELLDRLEQVRAGDPQGWTDVLRTTELLRSVASADPNRRARAVLVCATEAAGSGGGQPAPDALAGAVLTEEEANVAGTLRWSLAGAGTRRCAGCLLGWPAPTRACGGGRARRRRVWVRGGQAGCPGRGGPTPRRRSGTGLPCRSAGAGRRRHCRGCWRWCGPAGLLWRPRRCTVSWPPTSRAARRSWQR